MPRHTFTFPTADNNRPLTSTKLHSLVPGAQGYKQLAQDHYAATFWAAPFGRKSNAYLFELLYHMVAQNRVSPTFLI